MRPLQNPVSSAKIGRLFLPLPLQTFAKPRLDLASGAALSPSPLRVHCTTSLALESAVALTRTWANAAVLGVNPFKGTPVFTLSKGRGRFRRPRRKSVRGLPGSQARVTQGSPLRERAGACPGPRSGGEGGFLGEAPRSKSTTVRQGRRVLIPLLGERVGVRGLPRNQLRVTQRSPLAKGRGEALPGTHPQGYAKVSSGRGSG